MNEKNLPLYQTITLPEENLHRNAEEIEGYINHNNCLICTSHKTKDNKYPRVRRNGKDQRMHRYLFNKWNEEIPEGEIIRHTCDNTLCINPEHLLRGTHQDNANDRVERGRQIRGSQHKNAKLLEDQVYFIRFISEETNKELANKFNVSRSTIWSIRNNITWKDVTEFNSTELAA